MCATPTGWSHSVRVSQTIFTRTLASLKGFDAGLQTGRQAASLSHRNLCWQARTRRSTFVALSRRQEDSLRGRTLSIAVIRDLTTCDQLFQGWWSDTPLHGLGPNSDSTWWFLTNARRCWPSQTCGRVSFATFVGAAPRSSCRQGISQRALVCPCSLRCCLGLGCGSRMQASLDVARDVGRHNDISRYSRQRGKQLCPSTYIRAEMITDFSVADFSYLSNP